MKKVFLSILAVLAASSISAKVYPHFDVVAGYDHSDRFLFTDYTTAEDPSIAEGVQTGYSFDGFHVGGNCQLDFMDGKNIPSLILGVNYQFLANSHFRVSKSDYDAAKDKFMAQVAGLGGTNAKYTDLTTIHTIQVPINAQYTHRFNDNWSIMVWTGPQLRLHVAEVRDWNRTCSLKGLKNGLTHYENFISGNYKTTTWTDGVATETEGTTEEDYRSPICDLAWNIGFGFGYKFFSLRASYEMGMVNQATSYRQDQASTDNKTYYLTDNVFALTLGFRVL